MGANTEGIKEILGWYALCWEIPEYFKVKDIRNLISMLEEETKDIIFWKVYIPSALVNYENHLNLVYRNEENMEKNREKVNNVISRFDEEIKNERKNKELS